MKKEDEENFGPCTPRSQICDCFRNCCLWFQCGNYTEHQGCDLTCAIKITCIYSICVFTEICLGKDKQTVKTQFLSSKTTITWTTFDYPDTQRQLRCHGLACSHLCLYTYNWPTTKAFIHNGITGSVMFSVVFPHPFTPVTCAQVETVRRKNVDRRAAGLLNPNPEQGQSVMEAEGC